MAEQEWPDLSGVKDLHKASSKEGVKAVFAAVGPALSALDPAPSAVDVVNALTWIVADLSVKSKARFVRVAQLLATAWVSVKGEPATPGEIAELERQSPRQQQTHPRTRREMHLNGRRR